MRDEFDQALMDTQEIRSFVPETQENLGQLALTYPQDAEIMSAQGMRSVVVDQDEKLAAAMLARKKAIKESKDHDAGGLKEVKATMKWPPFLSTFVLNRMCDIIKSGVRTEKGFKEVHLNNVAKKVFNYCQQEVSSQQVYNHLRKWRARWIHVSKLRDLSGAGWDEGTHTIILEDEHYIGHVSVLTLFSS